MVGSAAAAPLTPEGVGSYRSRPLRVDAIYYDGENTADVIEFLERRVEDDEFYVNGDWEVDTETGEPMDCRYLDLTTVDGYDELRDGVWVVHTEIGIDLMSDEQFWATYQPLQTSAKAA